MYRSLRAARLTLRLVCLVALVTSTLSDSLIAGATGSRPATQATTSLDPYGLDPFGNFDSSGSGPGDASQQPYDLSFLNDLGINTPSDPASRFDVSLMGWDTMPQQLGKPAIPQLPRSPVLANDLSAWNPFAALFVPVMRLNYAPTSTTRFLLPQTATSLPGCVASNIQTEENTSEGAIEATTGANGGSRGNDTAPAPNTPWRVPETQTSGRCPVQLVTKWQDGRGGFYLEVTAGSCSISSAELNAIDAAGSRQVAPMSVVGESTTSGPTRYGGAVVLPPLGTNKFTISVTDSEGSVSTLSFEEATEFSEAFGWHTFTGRQGGTFGNDGYPINSLNGNLTFNTTDVSMPGMGDSGMPMLRGFNGQDSTSGPFGPGWTAPFSFGLEQVSNILFTGVKLRYPDGRTALFNVSADGIFSPASTGIFDTLTAGGPGYQLQVHNRSTINFNPQGRFAGLSDRNGNTVTPAYGSNGQLMSMQNSSGRRMDLAYNSQGLISQITGPEGFNTSYGYTNGLLTSATDQRGKVWRYGYDNGNLVSVTSPSGDPALRQRYDQNRRVVEQTVGGSARRTFSYNDQSRTTRATDANGHWNEHVYDAQNRLVRTRDSDPRGCDEQYGYDSNNQRNYVRDKSGNAWNSNYDSRGNLLSVSGPNNWSSSWEYNQSNMLTKSRDPMGRETTYDYDNQGNLTRMTNPMGRQRTFTYNSAGLPTNMTDFNNNSMTRSYDAQGNLTSAQNGVNSIVRYSYDNLGRTRSVTDANGGAFNYEYDPGTQMLRRVTGPGGYEQRYTYDDDGNLSSSTDANQQTTRYNYDSSQNLTRVTNPIGATTVYTYGAMSEMLRMEDAEGRVTQYRYDRKYQVTEVIGPDNVRMAAYTYDCAGRLETQTDANGRVTRYRYNALNEVTQTVENEVALGLDSVSPPDVNVTTSYEYDGTGNLVRRTDPNGTIIAIEYDRENRPVTQTINLRVGEPRSSDVNVTSINEYDGNGNVVRQVNPRGFATAAEYDTANRPVTITNALGERTIHTYDANNNPVTVKDAQGTVTRYEYDALNRPTRQILNHIPGAPASSDVNVTTRYEYDRVGNLTRQFDPRNNPTTYIYDAANRVREVVDAANGRTQYVYDKVNNLTAVIDANGNCTRFEYDRLNRRTSETDPADHSSSYTYDPIGNVTVYTNARGDSTVYTYDGVNRVKEVRDPLGGVTSMLYDKVGNTLVMTDANQNPTSFAHDGLYRVKTVTDAEGNATRYAHDANGNGTETFDAEGNRTESRYDEVDRMVRTTNALGESHSYSYYPSGQVKDVTAPDSVVTHHDYDRVYRLSDMTRNYVSGQPVSSDRNVRHRYTYDANGNLLTVTDPLSHTTRFTYDVLNRPVREVNALRVPSVWDYAYDQVGNMTVMTDANRHVTTYSYYKDYLLKRVGYDDGTSVSYQYDENHNPTVMTDTLGVSRWAYDKLDRVTNATDSLGRQLVYSYDAVGNRASLTYPNAGRTVRYSYYRNNWLRTVTDPDNRTTQYLRNRVGQMRHTDFGNSTYADATYDAANRLRSLTHKDSSGNVLVGVGYNLNSVGLRTRADMTYSWRNPRTVTEEYTYDPLRRLTRVTGTDGNYVGTYTYDGAGNRTRWAASDDRTTQTPGDGFMADYTYDEADRLRSATIRGTDDIEPQNITYQYDANGNRTSKEWTRPLDSPPVRGIQYQYDRENRLKLAVAYQTRFDPDAAHECTKLAYDGNGRRLVKEYHANSTDNCRTGGEKRTEYTLDGLDPIVEYTTWRGQPNVQRDEVYRGESSQILERLEFLNGSPGQNYWYHYDGRASVMGLTKQDGQSSHTYRYDEYGQITPEHGNFTDPHNHYTLGGKEWDESLDMYEFGARMYDPQVGVWLTPDPVRGSISDPRTLHRYTYVYNSPISFTDPYGYWGLSDAWDSISSSASKAWNKASGSASKAWNKTSGKVSNAWKGATESVAGAWNKVNETASNTTNKVKHWASNTWEHTQNKVSKAWNNVSGSVSKWWDSAEQKASSTWNNVTRTASDTWHRATRSVSSAWNSGKQQLSHSWSNFTDSVSNSWNQASEAVSNATNSITHWVDQHQEQIASVATNLAVTVTATAGVGALCAATVGVGCAVAAFVIGGAAGSGASTIVGNAVAGRPLDQDVVQNTVLGGITGLATGSMGQALSGVGGTIAKSLNLGSVGTSIAKTGLNMAGSATTGGVGNAMWQMGENIANGKPLGEGVGNSFKDGAKMGAFIYGGTALGGKALGKLGAGKIGRATGCSFTPVTLVSTSQGLRPIRELEEGDQVLAYNEQTDTTGTYTIAAVLVHLDPIIVTLLVDGKWIETTPEHPFYTEEKGWVAAGDLWKGAHIREADGTPGVLQDILVEYKPQLMYNLTVDQAHTFFVGQDQLLVHNQCSPLSEQLAREEFASNARWKPATQHGNELVHHAYNRHPSLATTSQGTIDPRRYDMRARSNIQDMSSEIHNVGGRYGAFNPNSGEFTVFSWEGGGGLPAGSPTIHTYFIPLRNMLTQGTPFNSQGQVNMYNIRR